MDEEYLFSTKVNSTFITVYHIFSYVYIHICLSIQTNTSGTSICPGPSLCLCLLLLCFPPSIMIVISSSPLPYITTVHWDCCVCLLLLVKAASPFSVTEGDYGRNSAELLWQPWLETLVSTSKATNENVTETRGKVSFEVG